MTHATLQDLRAKLAAATPGAWRAADCDVMDACNDSVCRCDFPSDAAIIAALRNHAGELFEAVEERDRLRAELEMWRNPPKHTTR